MSSLNSAPDTNHYLMTLLIKGVSLSREQLRSSGMDVAYLEASFEIVKPQLQFLGHYRPLTEQFERPHFRPHLEHIEGLDTGDELCLRIPGWGGEHALDIEPTRVHLLLTKSNWWIVITSTYSSRPEPEIGSKLFSSISELCAYLDTLESGARVTRRNLEQRPLACQVALLLQRMVSERIAAREDRLQSMKSMHGRLEALRQRVLTPF